ncbi:hypothetical protein F0562_004159 [Nyssa sinensis]|uniref:Uncharacterized protein n=1 Tax=Nyssa sinensis TaxID=561372 RepID=A0A5J5C0N6_9ASTE|nr:hypothetical protein F0562_004159 [Nyssa sinensis]
MESLSNVLLVTATMGTKSLPNVRKGAWTEEEDVLLRKCVHKYGEGNWHKVPQRPGLNRCRKSCRLRWLNYLRPDIKTGEFAWDEVDLIIRLHKLLGNRQVSEISNSKLHKLPAIEATWAAIVAAWPEQKRVGLRVTFDQGK